jgi:hypothetical protein
MRCERELLRWWTVIMAGLRRKKEMECSERLRYPADIEDQKCGSGLAREGGVSAYPSATDTPLSQASQLVSSRSLKLRRVRAVDGRLKASGA